jgi:hypothetical protein
VANEQSQDDLEDQATLMMQRPPGGLAALAKQGAPPAERPPPVEEPPPVQSAPPIKGAP